MTRLDQAEVQPVIDRMGERATIEDGRCMRALLRWNGYEPTQAADVPEPEWAELCDQAARMARCAAE